MLLYALLPWMLHDQALGVQSHFFNLFFCNLPLVIFLFLLDFFWEPFLHKATNKVSITMTRSHISIHPFRLSDPLAMVREKMDGRENPPLTPSRWYPTKFYRLVEQLAIDIMDILFFPLSAS